MECLCGAQNWYPHWMPFVMSEHGATASPLPFASTEWWLGIGPPGPFRSAFEVPALPDDREVRCLPPILTVEVVYYGVDVGKDVRSETMHGED